ncbi:hypothetical protein CYMTET_42310 [Cymbomonas tetramitiformis]|uniref:Uncharacterized protein n=1 Tax=Cymbomonas tetramitiformis TaxID=36881 RepID=A0AAE0C4F9_9CHLO|nr:hypothetical protein CYMTET_42310 [Cymbomonas tetramitiformis]
MLAALQARRLHHAYRPAVGCGKPAYGFGGSRFALTVLSAIMCLAFAGATASTAVVAYTATTTTIDSANDHGLPSPVVCIGELCLHGDIVDLSPELQALMLDRFFSAAASTSYGAPGGAQLQSGGVDIPTDMIP